MIGWPRQVRVFAWGEPVDMRKGYEGLSHLVRSGLARDPLAGDLFLFVAKRRRRAKVLFFDGTGLCLLSKRLDKGRFAALWRDDPAARRITLTTTELALFLEGSELVGRVALSPAAIDEKDLAARIRI